MSRLLTLADLNYAFGGTLLDSSGIAGAWTSLSAAVTADTGTLTASGTIRYAKLQRIVFINIAITVQAAGSGAGHLRCTIPFTAQVATVLCGQDTVTGKMLTGQIGASSNLLEIALYDGSYPGALGAMPVVSGVFEATA